MATNPRVVVDFVANTRDLAAGLGRAAGTADKAESKFGGMGKTAARVAGAAGLAALAFGLHRGVEEMAEAAKVGAQTAAVIKSTGGAARVTADHVGDLAGKLMTKSGVDDEAIQSGENLLLTFTNIRNEVGRGNAIFDRATAAALDMSVAMGTDVSSAALQVGKALNDPLKGMTKLQRVGVTFTQAQKDQVAALVESGNTLDAQKIILKELQKEFGGSAEAAGKTLPGQLAILNQSFNNLAGQVVGVLAPALSATVALFTKYPGLLKVVVFGVGALAIALVGLNAAMTISAAVAAGMLTPFLIIVGVLAAVGVAVYLAVKYWDQIKAAMVSVFDWIKTNWPLLLAIIAGPIGLAVALVARHWDTLVSGVKSAWDGVVSFLRGAGARVQAAMAVIGNWLQKPADWARDAAAGVRSAWDGLIGFLAGLYTRIASALDRVRDWLGRPGEWARSAVAEIRGAFDSMISYLAGLAARIAGPISRAADAIKSPLNAVIRAWNNLAIPGFHKSIPMPGPIPDVSFGWPSIGLPDIPMLASGAVISRPTLAVIGEGAGREVVTPESLLRQIVAEGAPEVRVFIGETELRSMIRYEVRRENQATAAAILGGTF